jgi:hypothetical protein
LTAELGGALLLDLLGRQFADRTGLALRTRLAGVEAVRFQVAGVAAVAALVLFVAAAGRRAATEARTRCARRRLRSPTARGGPTSSGARAWTALTGLFTVETGAIITTVVVTVAARGPTLVRTRGATVTAARLGPVGRFSPINAAFGPVTRGASSGGAKAATSAAVTAAGRASRPGPA